MERTQAKQISDFVLKPGEQRDDEKHSPLSQTLVAALESTLLLAVRIQETPMQRSQPTEESDDEKGGWLEQARAKYGLGTLLVAAGVVLFLFPEPATSTAGLLLIGAGALIWLVGWVQ